MYPYEPHSGTHPAPYWLRDDCHSKHYRDPYMNSFSCDDQLPLISSIGRGPKGAGITAKLLKDTDTEFIFSLVNDETGEQVFQSPNLAPAIVSVSAPKHTPIAGENYPITFSMRRGTDVSEYTVDIPSGAQGSLIYCLEDPIHLNSTTENENSGMWFKLANLGDTTFRTTIDHLLIYGEHDWNGKPIPRVNDIIFCPYWAKTNGGSNSIGVSFGTIEAVENGYVVWTARTFIPSLDISISADGTWVVGGIDTKVKATGPTGLPAMMAIGTVKETQQPMATIEKDPSSENTWKLNLGLPRGANGKTLNIRSGKYTEATLPPFVDTPVNDAFIVDDGDNRFDLYVRGAEPVSTDDGGPWTIVENWQGIQGYSIRLLHDTYSLAEEPLRIPSDQVDFMLTPSIGVIDGDLIIDSELSIGVVSSVEDGSGDYLVTRITAKMTERIEALETRLTTIEKILNNRVANEDIDKMFSIGRKE